MNHLNDKCKNCGFTFGAHRFTDQSCPESEIIESFFTGPGTKFEPKGKNNVSTKEQMEVPNKRSIKR